MMSTEGTAAALPSDYVRNFIEQLEHPETRLHTDTRRDRHDVAWSGTSWGDTGRAAILAEMKRVGELNMALAGIIDHWREFSGMMFENNTDYGFDERIELIAKLVGR